MVLLGVTNTDLNTISTIGVHWAVALIVVGIAVRGEKLSFADLGFRRPAIADLGYILGTAVGILLVYTGTPPLIEALGLPVSESGGLVDVSAGLGVAFAYAVTIGVVEEILCKRPRARWPAAFVVPSSLAVKHSR